MALIKSSNSSSIARGAIVLDLGDLRGQADQILLQARQQAEKIVRAGEAERQRLIQSASAEGRAEGLAEGLAKGHREGMAQGRSAALDETKAALAGLQSAWDAALVKFVGQRQQLLEDARRDVLRLACLIAVRVTKRAIELDPTIVQAQLDAVLALVMRPTRLRVRVHPADAALAKDALPALMTKYAAAADVEIVADAGVSRGSCVAGLSEVEGGGADAQTSASGEIDASIQTQLDRIIDTLLPAMAVKRGGASDTGAGGIGAGA